MPEQQTVGTYYFKLTLGGAESAGFFKECTGLSSEHQVVTHTSADEQGKALVQKFPGQLQWSNITLKRGVDESQELSNWRKQVLDEGPDSARVDGFIEMLDYNGTPIKRYKFLQGWPIKYTGVSFDPKSSDVAVEELQICHEGLEVE